MENLDRILELLRDSEWHDMEEIQKEIPVHRDQFMELIPFLEEQGLIRKEHKNMKITPKGLHFLGLPL